MKISQKPRKGEINGKTELRNLRTTKDDNEHKGGANEEKTYYFSYFSQHVEGHCAKRLKKSSCKSKGAYSSLHTPPKSKNQGGFDFSSELCLVAFRLGMVQRQ